MSAALVWLCVFPCMTFALLRGAKPVFACQSVLSRGSQVATIQKQDQISTEREVLARVKVPPAQETEQQLREKSFRDAYIAGWDEAHRLEAIADALRKNKVDPAVTHIEDFADQVEEHIAYFQRNTDHEIEIPAFKKKVVDREAMEVLVREARGKVKEKKVTYNWWMQWNLKMLDTVSETRLTGMVAEYRRELKSSLPAEENEIIVSFLKMVFGRFKGRPFDSDDLVYLPTIKKLDIMAFNQVSSNKLALLALFDRPAPADGLIFDPIPFLLHDLQHSYSRDLVDSFKYKVFHKLFKEKVKTLSTFQREKVELILYFHTHEVSRETSVDDFVKFLDTGQVGVHPGGRLTNENDMKHLLPYFLHRASEERVHDYFESAMAKFIEVTQKILKEQSEK